MIVERYEQKPMLTYHPTRAVVPSAQSYDAHFQGPHAPDPHLELSLHAIDIIKLDPLPPTSSRWFPPEQKKLLRHPHCAAAHLIPANVAPKAS